MSMFPLQEPSWGYDLILFLNEYMKYHDFLIMLIPITADIFVFFYPILLVVLYIIGIVKNSDYFKEFSLWIFWSAILTSLFNIFLQLFFDKARPIAMLTGQEEKTILHKFLPTTSFPSDHSAISMGLGMGILFWGITRKDKKIVCLGVIFVAFSLIMGFSRVMVGVHWPTDVLAGFSVGIIIPLILIQPKIFKVLKKISITPIINLQKWIWRLFGAKY